MLHFKSLETPASYTFIDPDDGYKYEAKTRFGLVTFISSYRAQNGLPEIKNINLVIDNYLCGLPENTGKCCPVKLRRGIYQYIKGGIALIENLFYGEANIVSQEEADRRAKICVDCGCNVFPDKDKFLSWSDDLALASVGEKKSTYHDLLGNCEGCSCTLKAKVFYKGPFKLSGTEKEKMKSCNSLCWQV